MSERGQRARAWTRALPCPVPQFVIIVVVLFGIAILFPYTGDDWAWGSAIGLKRLSRWFADYNGRYVGNLLVIALTRSVLLRSIVVSLTVVGMAWCISAIVSRNDSLSFWLALVLLLAMPPGLRAQGIVWTSGFTNYAVPVLLILVYLVMFRGVFEEGGSYEPHMGLAIPAFALGLTNALLMENVTLVNVGASLVILLYTRIRHGVWDKVQLAFLSGATAGAFLMFSNGAYHQISEGNDNYRSVSDKLSLFSLARKYVVTIAPQLCTNNLILNMISAACAWGAYAKRRGRGSRMAFLTLSATALVSMIALVVSVVTGKTSSPKVLLALGAVASVLWLLAMTYVSYDQRRPLLGIAVVTFVVTLTAPLLVVSPIGPRNFLITYVLLVLLVCLCVDLVLDGVYQERLRKVMPYALACVLLCWTTIYSVIGYGDWQRRTIVNDALVSEADEVTVPRLPLSELVHVPNPEKEPWNSRFKLFYGLADDVVLRVE